MSLLKGEDAFQKFHALRKGRVSHGSCKSALDRQPLADTGRSAQTTLPATATGSQAADDEATVGTLPPSLIQKQLLNLRLSNPSNHCFINASMVAMMWASLQRRHFAMTDWGMLQDGLSLLLKRGEKPTLVQWMLFFEQKLPGWDGSAQCDAAEFTLALMAQMDPSVFHGLWERRYQRENGFVKRYGREVGAFALTLTVMPQLHCEWHQLVENWTHDSGMVAAYVHLPMLICIQLGRAHPIPVSIVSFDLSFRLPRFSGDELHLEYFDYQVVAACTHLGKSGAGHYRAALLLCDDGEQPTKIHTIPCWFSTQVCLLWAVRISAKSPLAHCPVQAAVVVFSRLWFSIPASPSW